MVAIPNTKDTDPEDVVWGLQTAEALWKRGERIDAIVWLRRAAQAAGDAADDDRALELARAAAELSDWMATEPEPGTEPPPAMDAATPSASPPPVSTPPSAATPPTSQRPHDPHNAATFVPFGDDAMQGAVPRQPTTPTYRPTPPSSLPPSSPTLQVAEPFFPPPEAIPPADELRLAAPQKPWIDDQGFRGGLDEPGHDDAERNPSVPPAEHVHAGMFNPWDDGALPAPAPVEPVEAAFSSNEEEVITSLRPDQLAAQRTEGLAASVVPGPSHSRAPSDASPHGADTPAPEERPATVKPAPGRPPPLPARARKPPVPGTSSAPSSAPSIPSAPRASAAPAAPMAPRAPMAPMIPRLAVGAPPSSRKLPVAPPRPAPVTPAPPSPTQVMAQPAPRRQVEAEAPAPDDFASVPVIISPETEPKPIAAEPSEPELSRATSYRPAEVEGAAAPTPAPPAPAAAKLDLDAVEAFADLPDDARTAFAAAAKVSTLDEGEEVSGFALAFILEGTVDVAATMVDAPAARLAAGAVLRSRGTTDEGVPMRLIGVQSGIVATWTDAEVEDAFRTCPWVEEDLRTAADRTQTLVGVTIGPLGERLDASIREQIIGKLTMRTLIAGDVVVTQGEQMVGLILIGVGELELMDGDKVAGVVGSGEFLFATEVLGGGDVPRTARAGAGGALILYGDRHIAQELLVTCPPLLEVFAGM